MKRELPVKAFFPLVAIVSLATQTAQAYPIALRCEAGGHLSESVSKSDLQFLTKAQIPGANLNEVLSLRYQAWLDCESQKSQFANLIRGTKEIESPFAQDGAPDPTSLLSINRAIYTCRQKIENADPAHFQLAAAGTNLISYYPYSNPYEFAMGFRPDQNHLEGMNAETVRQEIAESVAMGVDPYVPLTLHLMETGHISKLQDLYLDPVADLEALGCSGTSASKASANLYSFETYYHFQFPELVSNPGFLKRLKNFPSFRGKISETESSYFCMVPNDQRDDYGNKIASEALDWVVSEKPQPKSCCLKLDFRPNDLAQAGVDIDEALKYYFIHTKVENGSASGPAERLQTYNGFSDLMGSNEATSAWRGGVNHFHTPTYGYQATDFILNTLLPNPLIRKMVRDAEAQSGVYPKSILCRDRAPGIFEIDSASYFEIHRDAPRMPRLIGKLKANDFAWTSLSARERVFLRSEFQDSPVEKRLIAAFPALKPEREWKGLFTGNDQGFTPPTSAVIRYYVESIYPLRRTVGLAGIDHFNDVTNYSWKRLTNAEIKTQIQHYRSQR